MSDNEVERVLFLSFEVEGLFNASLGLRPSRNTEKKKKTTSLTITHA